MARKESQKERSTNDVYELVGEFFSFTKNQFEKIEKRFEKHDRLFDITSQEIGRLGKDLKDLKTTVGHIEQDVLTVKEDVDAIAKTVARDSLTLKSHSRRLVNLERSRFH